jgi:hemerythrin-like domain-containing protein
MKPTEELKHDHEIIMHMLAGAEKLSRSIISTRTVNTVKVKDVIDFSRHFTDMCHHSKEEKHFFVRLQERGMSKDQGPIAVMLYEHRLGRELIHEIENALNQYELGKKEDSETVAKTMLRYIELLKAHIAKENNILFPMSEKILTPADQHSLEESFKIIEEQEIGVDAHEKYHRMAHEIDE